MVRLKPVILLILSLIYSLPGECGLIADVVRSRLDPNPRYFTLRSEHFEIHYAEENYLLATKLKARVEGIRAKVLQRLEIDDSKLTHIVLAQSSDEPHVFATIFPERLIFLDAAQPHFGVGLNEFTEWHEWVISHELAHVIHLDQSNKNLKFFESLFGSTFRLQQVQPLWLKEGIAVDVESSVNTYGRGQSSFFKMLSRTMVAEGTLNEELNQNLSLLTSPKNLRWPWLNRPYFFGYEFVKSLRELGVNPTTIWPGSKLCMNDSPASNCITSSQLVEVTSNRLQAEALIEMTQIYENPVTELNYLTTKGQLNHGLYFDPNQRLLYYTSDDAKDGVQIQSFDPEAENNSQIVETHLNSPKAILERSNGYYIEISKSGRFLVFDQIENELINKKTSDIFIYDLESRSIISRSFNFHAREPTIHPNGEFVTFVQNRSGANTLVTCDTSFSKCEELLKRPVYQRITGPRYSPSGEKIIFSIHNTKTGSEDLAVIEKGTFSVVLSNNARNLFPIFMFDEQTIMFSSDRSGIFNVFQLDLKSNNLKQLSNVVGGLLGPMYDPVTNRIYAISYHSKGYDLAWFEYPELPDEPKQNDPVPTQDTNEISNFKSIHEFDPPSTEAVLLPKSQTAYLAARELFPQFAYPTALFRPNSFQLGVKLGAKDPLGFYQYELSLRRDLQGKQFAGHLEFIDAARTEIIEYKLGRDILANEIAEQLEYNSEDLMSASIYTPLSHRHDYAFFGLLATQSSKSEMSPFLGYRIGYQFDREFKRSGRFQNSDGSRLILEYQYLTESKKRKSFYDRLSLELKTHFEVTMDQVLTFGLNSGKVFRSRHDSGSFNLGGKWSFPYTYQSDFLLWGYPVNYFVENEAHVASIRCTSLLKGLGESINLGVDPEHLTFALQAQAAYLPYNKFKTAESVGIELNQRFLAFNVWEMNASLGYFLGNQAKGGFSQFYFSLGADDVSF